MPFNEPFLSDTYKHRETKTLHKARLAFVALLWFDSINSDLSIAVNEKDDACKRTMQNLRVYRVYRVFRKATLFANSVRLRMIQVAVRTSCSLFFPAPVRGDAPPLCGTNMANMIQQNLTCLYPGTNAFTPKALPPESPGSKEARVGRMFGLFSGWKRHSREFQRLQSRSYLIISQNFDVFLDPGFHKQFVPTLTECSIWTAPSGPSVAHPSQASRRAFRWPRPKDSHLMLSLPKSLSNKCPNVPVECHRRPNGYPLVN